MRDILAILSWWLLIQLIGLIAWPLAFRLLRFLPDRGYTAAKPLGLLLVSYALWLLGSLQLMQNSIGGTVFALILVAMASAWALSRDGIAALRAWLTEHRAMVLVYEVLFIVAMCGWAAYRATNPAINSTEKPMEFAFLNAILRSSSFPPQDPWLSGFGISYYYFGYVMMAVMTRLAGTFPGVAYNVSHGLWFALIAGGAFGAAYQISNLKSQTSNTQHATRNMQRATAIGVLAAVMIALMGNLEGVLELAHQNGIGSPETWQWLDIKDLSGPPTTGGGIKSLRFYWWWRASRVVHDYTPTSEDQEVIDEFPFFSFFNGDLHPHTLAYPFVFLAISLALNVYRGKRQDAGGKMQDAGSGFVRLASCLLPPADLDWPDLFLYATCLGGLGFLNTWDFPIYLALVVAAFALRRWQDAPHAERLGNKVIADVVILGAVLAIAGFALYLPFYLSFQSQARGILPNLFNATRLPQFLVMFGPFVVPGALFLLILAAARAQVSAWRFWLGVLGWAMALLVAAMLVGLLLGVISPDGRAALAAWQKGEPIPGVGVDIGADILTLFYQRLSDPWTALFLTVWLVVIVKLLWQSVAQSVSQSVAQSISQSVTQSIGQSVNRSIGQSGAQSEARESNELAEEVEEAEPLTQPAVPFVLLLLLLGAALTFLVEYIYLADLFGTRMNTVFKFYYQAWALWGVAAACVIGWMVEDSALWRPLRIATGAVTALLVIAGLAYPLMAISTVGDPAHPTLDGTAWVAQSAPDDYAAIQWLNQNVAGVPVILEAPGESYHAELSRVSAYTGLPTVLGWDFHEYQWRGTFAEAGARKEDVKKIFTTRDIQEALTLMNKYAISYVYVGSAERAMFPAASLQKFDTMMNVVFQQGNVTVYQRK